MFFLYPGYFLLLLPIIILLILLYFNYGKNKNFSAINDLKKVFKFNSIYIKIYYIIIFFIFVLFISIFSKPVIQDVLEKNNKNGIDIQIVLDVSYSMIAEDLKPNRLEVAKDVISNFLEKINSDRVGIIVFAGKTFTSLPLSFDYNIIKNIIDKISVETINQRYMNMQGTAVGDALVLASDTFGKENKREKVVILLTDGEANKGIDPISALKYINKEYEGNIKVYTIGIGGKDSSFITIKDNFGINQKVPISGIDEETLKLIAKKTGGKYFRAGDRKTLENIFTEISKLEKRKIEVDELKINKEKYDYFIYLLILFFISFLLLKYIKRV